MADDNKLWHRIRCIGVSKDSSAIVELEAALIHKDQNVIIAALWSCGEIATKQSMDLVRNFSSKSKQCVWYAKKLLELVKER